MATLYEIDNAIMECIDFETGEIVDFERLEELQMERERKLENVALWIKNLKSDADAIKAEKQVLDEREKAARNKFERLTEYLSNALDGQKMTTSKVAISFRKSESVEIPDETMFADWAAKYYHDDLLNYKAPTPNKTAIKAALKDGALIKGATLITKNNMQIK